MPLHQPDEALHARGVAPQAWLAFIEVDAHLDPEFSPYETRKRHGLADRKPLRIDAQLIAIRCTVIHDPHREAKLREISCEEIDRNDLRVAGVEPLADFRERRMRDGSEIVSRTGSARGASHELRELRVLPIDQTALARPVMDAKAPARRRLQQRPVSEQRTDDQFPLPGTERQRPSATSEMCLYDKLSSLGIAPKGFTDMSRCSSPDHSDEEPNYELLGEISLLSPE